jgi:hypothetical protein
MASTYGCLSIPAPFSGMDLLTWWENGHNVDIATVGKLKDEEGTTMASAEYVLIRIVPCCYPGI